MNVKFYPKTSLYGENERGFSESDIRNGTMWLYADVVCPSCGKNQSVASTGYVGGPCISCGKKTDGSV